ncbi:MAG TPA: DUF1292 domain-containing protein [Firmicutes bacterium]|nr:DUF1292 domain-containing protein [Bacillota bacterium]
MPEKEESLESDLVTLVDEQGKEHDFIIEDIFEYQDKRYAVLVPFIADELPEEEQEEDDLEAYIFRIELEEGEEVLVEVENEKEWEQAASWWENLRQDLGTELDQDEEFN